MDYDSRNLIYSIVCSGRGEKYILQQTGFTCILKNRVIFHKQQQILHEDKWMLGMSEHILESFPSFQNHPFLKI